MQRHLTVAFGRAALALMQRKLGIMQRLQYPNATTTTSMQRLVLYKFSVAVAYDLMQQYNIYDISLPFVINIII